MDEFYGSAAAYLAYHLSRGRDQSARSTDEIERALLIATEWMDGWFSWPGYKVGTRETQVLDWPRSEVFDRDGWPVDYRVVPREIEHATYELAMRWLDEPTVLSPDHTPEKYKRVSIDGALSVEYRGLGATAAQKQFPILGVILARLTGGSNVSPLSSSMARS